MSEEKSKNVKKNQNLKLCPFCGHEAKLGFAWIGDIDEYHIVQCGYCGALVYSDQDEAEVIRNWNRRVNE